MGGRKGKGVCETGLIRFVFKSDNSLGGSTLCQCPWLSTGNGEGMHTSSAWFRQTKAAVPGAAERRAAEDRQLHFHPVHWST